MLEKLGREAEVVACKVIKESLGRSNMRFESNIYGAATIDIRRFQHPISLPFPATWCDRRPAPNASEAQADRQRPIDKPRRT